MSIRRSERRRGRRSTSEGVGKDLRSRYNKDYKDEEPYKDGNEGTSRGSKKDEKRNWKREINPKGRTKEDLKRQLRKREFGRNRSYKKSKNESKKESSKIDSSRRSKRTLSPNDEEEISKRKKICTKDITKKCPVLSLMSYVSSKEKSSKAENSKDTSNKEETDKKPEINKPECRPSCSYETGEVEWSPYFDIIFVHCLHDCDLVRLNKNFWRILMRDRFYSMIDIECPLKLFEEKLDLYQAYILQKCKKQLAWYPSKSSEFSIPKEWILERGLSVD